MTGKQGPGIIAVLFDFGGVLAEEGFRDGLKVIARQHGVEAEPFYRAARRAVYETGYVLGKGTEAGFWDYLRRDYPITRDDRALSEAILARFQIRPALFEAVHHLRTEGVVCAILSDQTDWLERLDRRLDIFGRFDRVYNSYRLGKGKRDPTLFNDVVADLNVPPGQVLFLDDTEEHIRTARTRGLRVCHCQTEHECLDCLRPLAGSDSEVP